MSQMKIILAFALGIVMAGTLHAQSLPDKPQAHIKVELTYPAEENAKHDVWLPVPHRTADKAWVSWNAASFAACGVDLGLALSHLNQEGNPIVRRAPALAVGICAGTVALAGYESWKWKREEDAVRAAGIEHRGVRWWMLDAAVVAPHAVGIAISAATLGHK